MSVSGINKYLTFGLKPEWISVLAEEKEKFRNTAALGNRMVPSAVTWFKEAGLVEEKISSVTPTLLLDIGEKLGFRDAFFWKLIWIRLANVSPLIKWFVCNCDKDEQLTVRQIDEKLALSVSSDSVRKGALQSLCSIIKSSPIGDGENAWVQVQKTGRNILGLTRKSIKAEGLALLYSVYVVAQKMERKTFTIRDILETNFENEFVSPLCIFGMSVEDFKSKMQGLESRYSNFIGCKFTFGLDEINVSKSTNDILRLILEEV
jgi:hypothetical protein